MAIEILANHRPGGIVDCYVVYKDGTRFRSPEGRSLIIKELNNGWQVAYQNPADIWGGKRFHTMGEAVAYVEKIAA